MVRHIRSPASPSHISGFVARQRTVSGEERAGAHLREAALRGDLVGAVRWLAAGAEQAAVVNSSDGDGTTALHKACQYSRIQIVQALLASGANTNAVGYNGRTPLHGDFRPSPPIFPCALGRSRLSSSLRAC
jgi:hypothetical protein